MNPTLQTIELSNNKSKVTITNLGASLMSWEIKNRIGELIDIVLGFNKAEQYYEKHPSFGSTVGRYANRIAKGQFYLNGKLVQLDVNNGPNHLHGGLERFGARLWNIDSQTATKVIFSYTSPDGESHFPGTLKIQLSYELTQNNELVLSYLGESDKDTICNLTNHAYFNLEGESSGDIFNHEFEIKASHFLPTDKTSIPTGVYQHVQNTVMDFRTLRKIIKSDFSDPILSETLGYDHNYVISRNRTFKHASTALSRKSGLQLDCYTDKPGLQFYIANTLPPLTSKLNKTYQPYQGFCFEAQFFPDSPNKSYFPSPFLKKGEKYEQRTVYKVGEIQ